MADNHTLMPLRIYMAMLLLVVTGCSRWHKAATPTAAQPAIASTVPAATDILLAIGAGNHLAAVSIYDTDPRVAQLPRCGDYQTTDWELLTRLRPRVMIVQVDPSRLPAGFKQRASDLGMGIEDINLNRLSDILSAIDQLGRAASDESAAAAFRTKLQNQLDAVARRTAAFPKVRTLLAMDDGHSLIGSNTYLNDLLVLAGGDNVAAALAGPYPSADAELLRALNPEVIIHLLPGANPQVRQAALLRWQHLPELTAVRTGRIVILDDPWVLMPASHIGDMAEKFAYLLHSRPSTTQSSILPLRTSGGGKS